MSFENFRLVFFTQDSNGMLKELPDDVGIDKNSRLGDLMYFARNFAINRDEVITHAALAYGTGEVGELAGKPVDLWTEVPTALRLFDAPTIPALMKELADSEPEVYGEAASLVWQYGNGSSEKSYNWLILPVAIRRQLTVASRFGRYPFES